LTTSTSEGIGDAEVRLADDGYRVEIIATAALI